LNVHDIPSLLSFPTNNNRWNLMIWIIDQTVLVYPFVREHNVYCKSNSWYICGRHSYCCLGAISMENFLIRQEVLFLTKYLNLLLSRLFSKKIEFTIWLPIMPHQTLTFQTLIIVNYLFVPSGNYFLTNNDSFKYRSITFEHYIRQKIKFWSENLVVALIQLQNANLCSKSSWVNDWWTYIL